MDEINTGITDSTDQSSDIVHDFPCTTCDKDGKNVEASKYCVECAENLCVQCIKQHNRFAAMKSHQLLDECVSSKIKHPSSSQKCERHSGKLIEIYCPAHDDVCCSVCVALEHSLCKGMKYLPDAAKGFRNSDMKHQLERDIEKTNIKLSDLKERIHEKVEHLKVNEESLLEAVEAMEEKIDKHVSKLKEDIRNQIRKELKLEIDTANDSIAKLGKIVESLRKPEKILKDVEKADDMDVFVSFKKAKGDVYEGEEFLNKYGTELISESSFSLQFDYHVKKVLDETKSLAVLTKKDEIKSAKIEGEFSIKIPKDKENPVIGSMCEVNDAQLIVTDVANCRIKKLNYEFKVISHLDLQACPYSVCYIGVKTVAVTMKNSKVQFVLLNEPMVRTLTFTVGARCRAVVCSNKELYICCGGNHTDTPGCVEVYDLHGTHKRTYFFEHTSMPMDLCLSSTGWKVFMADKRMGLVVMDKNFEVETVIKDTYIKALHAVCVIGDTHICVVDQLTNKIMLLDECKRILKCQCLLSPEDGLGQVKSICYIKRRKQLLVTMNKREAVKVFTLVL